MKPVSAIIIPIFSTLTYSHQASADVVRLGKYCGAKTGDAPRLGAYCRYYDNKCGVNSGKPGIATTIPQFCTADVKPVCGCDGTTYTNSCEAARRGVSVQSSGYCEAPTAKFRVGFDGTRNFPDFIVQVRGRANIDKARRLLASKGKFLMIGTITKAPADYNKDYVFHIEPQTLQFGELAPEVCDGNPRYVERLLYAAGGSFLPGAVWCPWSSYLKSEVGKK